MLIKKVQICTSYFLIHTNKILLLFVFVVAYEVCGAKPKIISSKSCKYHDVSCVFFNPYIQDCHFSKRLVSQYKVLYSNIYVKKTDDIFVVEKSDNQDFQVIKSLEIEDENLTEKLKDINNNL